MIEDLPTEIFSIISNYLKNKDIGSLSVSSKNMYTYLTLIRTDRHDELLYIRAISTSRKNIYKYLPHLRPDRHRDKCKCKKSCSYFSTGTPSIPFQPYDASDNNSSRNYYMNHL